LGGRRSSSTLFRSDSSEIPPTGWKIRREEEVDVVLEKLKSLRFRKLKKGEGYLK